MLKESSFIGLKKLHVFIADDDPDDLEFFTLAIKAASEQIKITVASNGQELLEFLQLVIPDIIFLDLNMPCMNGVDCLKAIRAQRKLDKVPVIVYSTTSNKEHIDSTYELGANLYIEKPPTYSRIENRINETLSLNMKDLFPQVAKERYLVKAE